MLVSAAKCELSIKLDIARQTGYRPIEISGEKGLRASDFHPDQPSLTNRNTKKCNARPAMPITPELAMRIADHIRNHKLSGEDILFTGDHRRFGEHYRRFRNKLAEKLKDPSIKAIRLYDLRHFYCTEKLRRIQNAEIVRQLMGHKNLNTTQKYMHLLPNLQSGEYEVEYTNDKNRAKELLLNDFKYELTTPDGYMMFRRPK
jgi:integrase